MFLNSPKFTEPTETENRQFFILSVNVSFSIPRPVINLFCTIYFVTCQYQFIIMCKRIFIGDYSHKSIVICVLFSLSAYSKRMCVYVRNNEKLNEHSMSVFSLIFPSIHPDACLAMLT